MLLDRDKYVSDVKLMLSDEHTYKVLLSDPTQHYKRKLIGLLKMLKDDNKITEQQYRYLYPTAELTPCLYCTPKIHKASTPLRPIVDYTGSIGYNLSQSIADLLAPIVGKTKYHTKNSKELATQVKNLKIGEHDIFNSHDVVSLFTNTPIKSHWTL